MGTKPEAVAITGAAGRIGSVVRVGLRDEVARLVLIDRAGLTAQTPAEEVHQLDLRDAEAVTAVLKDLDAVVHLGGLPDVAPLPDLLDGNVRGTHNVLEGARRQGVRRVVLASSNRVSGFYRVAETVTLQWPDAACRHHLSPQRRGFQAPRTGFRAAAPGLQSCRVSRGTV
ncbi:NAD-dependent epimerase/dehydratase family protein [Streptomyces sp. NBC_01198]|uniref:NAD-dependent epimerase/dehydratase family protein n=1 Tax=Streptomyces sp. NBC_01198 TaxID=2903769 RepID=UPI002E121566|nr:NAD(P)-dependent oxidoreductase [Streptomyces sp. NBC_01198]